MIRDGDELLVTQLFFAGDAALDGSAIGNENVEALLLTLEPYTDEAGFALQRASHILIVDAR